MTIKKPADIPASEITDPQVYLNRRRFMQAGILAATTAATGWAYYKLNFPPGRRTIAPPLANVIASTQVSPDSGFRVDEPLTSFEDITHYNNFYEFSTDKASVASAAQDYAPTNWKVAVGGLCNNPKTFDLDDLLKLSPPEERIYRMRCVEGWSMVIPWDGFSLSKLLDQVEPKASAKYVGFTSVLDPDHMPNQSAGVLPWPYVEGLRMDEAMHPLTILVSGIYGRKLPPQDGAPIRLVVPWKYGFKGIKSIVKIELMAGQPPTTWNIEAPSEYGFYANVNPNVDHPRWSQATEMRIGDLSRRPTLMFNGYADQVADLYTGMDLRENF
jgi:sulfoxide reductase catalytic subunit YedY